jgi:TAG lipase / lysophosphatidylethanolamine acyltransferase
LPATTEVQSHIWLTGSTTGLYHIGVVKALHERDLLPRIISGTAVGALIAALICIHTDEELPVNLK